MSPCAIRSIFYYPVSFLGLQMDCGWQPMRCSYLIANYQSGFPRIVNVHYRDNKDIIIPSYSHRKGCHRGCGFYDELLIQSNLYA